MIARAATARRGGAARVHARLQESVAHRRLQHLYEISKLLTRFVNVGRTLADILVLITEEVPLATAILLVEGPTGPRMMVWSAEGLAADRRILAEENARRRYAELVRPKGGDPRALKPVQVEVNVLPGVALEAFAPPAQEETWPPGLERRRFVVLPLVVERYPIFGALQIESLSLLDERDLGFVNAVVNQLAVVLDRKTLFDAQQEVSESRRLHAERERSEAKDLQALAEAAEQRYRGLVNNLDQAFVWEADAHTLGVSHISAPAQPLLGYSLERWKTQPDLWLDVVHPADREPFRLALRRALHDGTDQRLDHRVVAIDGTLRWLHTGMHIASDRGRQVIQAVSVDITALKENEARDRLLAEASRLVVVAVDHDDLVELLARAATPALGDVCVIDLVGESGELEPATEAFADAADAALAERLRAPVPGSSVATLKAQALHTREAVLFHGDVGSMLALPLIAHGRVLGVLTLASVRADRYGRADLALAEEFVLRAGLVLDNAQLYRDAERRSAIQKTITDNATACLILVDADDHATFMNPAAVNVTGYILRDLEQRRLHDVLHGTETAGPSSWTSPKWTSSQQPKEDTLVRRDGTSFPASCNVAPLVSGGAVVEFRDVTVEKQAEHFRELFVGMLGHDLRSPLSAIVMSADVILKRGGLVEPYERALRRIATSAERMKVMIAQILDFTRGRLARGIPITRRRVDICEVVKRIVDELGAAQPGQTFDLVMPFACEGEWDPDRLEQVVSNLVGNALTHGRAGSPIQIRLAPFGEAVELAVRNQGTPIPAALLSVIFDPFQSGDSHHASHRRGLGLGLYITERIVVAHGGTIGVRSTAEEGTTFTITLPLQAPPAPSSRRLSS